MVNCLACDRDRQGPGPGFQRYPCTRSRPFSAGFGPAVFGAFYESDGNYDAILLISSVLFVVGAVPLLLLGKYRDYEEPLEAE